MEPDVPDQESDTGDASNDASGDVPSSYRKSDSPAPDALDEQDLEKLYQLASSLYSEISTDPKQGSSKEKELLELVLRLSKSSSPLKTQLLSQAETIGVLARQRQYLLDRMEEERYMWGAEKESWSRISEALLLQASRYAPSIYREQDVPNSLSTVETENAALKQKLTENQARLTALESELAQLRPILLMQPFALSHSNAGNDSGRARRKKKDPSFAEKIDGSPTGPALESDTATPKDKKALGQYYKHREDPSGLPSHIFSRRKGSSSSKHNAILADARAEHLLLAARKIGKERASILSSQALNLKTETSRGIGYQGKGKAKADDSQLSSTADTPSGITASPSTPKTPQKSSRAPFPSPTAPFPPPAQPFVLPATPVPRPPGSIAPHQPPFAYVSAPTYALYSPATFTYGAMPFHSPSHASPSPRPKPTPSQSNATAGPSWVKPASTTNSRNAQSSPAKEISTPSHSSTPLAGIDSLLSAAHSVLSPTESGSPANPETSNTTSGRRSYYRQRAPDGSIESPTPKRRRADGHAASKTNGSAETPSRKTSALDVLADQAMVAGSSSQSSQTLEQSPRPLGELSAVGGADVFEDDDHGLVKTPTKRRSATVKQKANPRKPQTAPTSSKQRNAKPRPSSLGPPIDITRSPRKKPRSTDRPPTRLNDSKRKGREEEIGEEVEDEDELDHTRSHREPSIRVDRKTQNAIVPSDDEALELESEDENNDAEPPANRGKGSILKSSNDGEEILRKWQEKLGILPNKG